MKSFRSLSLTIGLLLIFTHYSSLLFSMEKEEHLSALKPIPGTTSWRPAAPNKHQRKRSLSAFSHVHNSGESRPAGNSDDELELPSFSPPTVVRSNSSPEQRNKKSASHIVHRKGSDAFLTLDEIPREAAKETEGMNQFKKLGIPEKRITEQTKRADAIIASLPKPSELKRKLNKPRYLLCINHRGKHGEPPLHRAIESSMVGTLRVLLEAGAEINCQDILGNTALHKLFSIYNEGSEWYQMYAEFLKHKKKLQPDLPNLAGKKVLYYVLISGMVDQVKYLIELDANVTLQTSIEKGSESLALLKTLDQTDQTEMIKELLIEHGAKDTKKHLSETVRPKTRSRAKSKEAIATLRKYRESNHHLPSAVSEALRTLLEEHENNSGEDLGTFDELTISEEGRIRREISTLDFNKEQLQKYRDQFTEQKDGKPHETFDSMPIAGDSKEKHLITRVESPSEGHRKNRGKTVYTALPSSEDEKEEDEDPVITIRLVSSPQSTRLSEDKHFVLE